MLFKPLSDFPEPRHLLSSQYDEETGLEELETCPEPKIDFTRLIELTQGTNTTLIILPHCLHTIYDYFPKNSWKEAGNFAITKGTPGNKKNDTSFGERELNSDSQQRNNAIYDEDIGLYAPSDPNLAPGNSLSKSLIPSSIKLYVNTLIPSLFLIKLPILADELDSPIARFILQTLVPQKLVVLSPSSINRGINENQLALLFSSSFTLTDKYLEDLKKMRVQLLTPPSFITGISASFLSNAEMEGLKAVSLVYDAEGPTNYERVDPSTLTSSLQVLQYILELPNDLITNDKRMKKVAKQSFGATNSRMYI